MVRMIEKENLFGLIGINGYECIEYPKFGVVVTSFENAFVIHNSGSAFSVLSKPFHTKEAALEELCAVLEEMETIEELKGRLE